MESSEIRQKFLDGIYAKYVGVIINPEQNNGSKFISKSITKIALEVR